MRKLFADAGNGNPPPKDPPPIKDPMRQPAPLEDESDDADDVNGKK